MSWSHFWTDSPQIEEADEKEEDSDDKVDNQWTWKINYDENYFEADEK